MRWLELSALMAWLLACAPAHAQSGTPARAALGHTVISTHDPDVRIELPASAAYVGTDLWLLKAYADNVELFAFVDADTKKHVSRIYWIQFEAYRPSRPELKHTYDSKRHAILGGMDFFVDTWVQSTAAPEEPDSDGAHLKALLSTAGYTLPKSMMSVRFVHLMDKARKELMFIYSEDTTATGFTADDLRKGGRAFGEWPGIEAGLIQRGERGVELHPPR